MRNTTTWTLIIFFLFSCSKGEEDLRGPMDPIQGIMIQISTTSAWTNLDIIRDGTVTERVGSESPIWGIFLPKLDTDTLIILSESGGISTTLSTRIFIDGILRSDSNVTRDNPRILQKVGILK
tara:strand:- start:11722 stop:12090 length:369 start_codon:yes stop_codon:yes gene_type:complete